VSDKAMEKRSVSASIIFTVIEDEKKGGGKRIVYSHHAENNE